MQRAKHVPYRPAVIILIFTFLLITTACRNTEDISDAYSNSSASAATENENEKINAVETSEQPIVRSASKEMPVMNLKEAAPGKGWEVLKSSDLEFAGGKKLTVKCCGQVAVDAREIRAFLEYGGKSFEIGTISNYGMDQVYIQMIELTGDSTEELTITGDMGSTISVTKILGYDARGCFWTQLLDADNTIMTDLDTDGTMEVTSCSKGSLPSYLWIYKWNGKAYSMLDAAAATGNEYALLKELDSGCCIEAGEVRQGEKPDYHYYFYRDGKLIPHSDAFLREKDYILPESSERTLKEDDIEYLTNDGLNLAIQEIYARHGLIFKDEAYGSYFTQKSWYVMNEAYDEKLLSSIEKQNAAFLKQEAEKSGMYFSKVEGNTAKLDLNGDKVKDLVRLECEPGSNSYTLYINDISVTGDGDNLDGVLFLCDINKSDRYNELAVTESGPSGDYRTYFYCYDGKQIRFMGVIQGSGPSVRMTGMVHLHPKQEDCCCKPGSIPNTTCFRFLIKSNVSRRKHTG